MTTHKERIESLEEGLNHLYKAESDRAARLSKLEENVARITELLEKWHGKQKIDEERYQQRSVESNEGREGRMIVSSKSAKLEFPRFVGEDPTEWRNRVEQYFEFQKTPDDQKILLASYHLEGEANQWWQSIRRAYRKEGKELQWLHFKEELWARFGPPDCEDFDEALAKIRQNGPLREYQKEFERLGNLVTGWTQKALVGTFIGGLRAEIAEGIRMFKLEHYEKLLV